MDETLNLTPPPLQCAAIDAGSNAIRLLIADAISPTEIRKLEVERVPVRLGHHVFTAGSFDDRTIDRAVEAFRHFAALFARYGVVRYRAVATSATREAKNRADLLDRLRKETGIELEVIDGAEEALLVERAVDAALPDNPRPILIADLGGGSLDISLRETGTAARSLTLPVGTVRMMETLGLDGAIKKKDIDRLREKVQPQLEAALPRIPDLARGAAVVCGGNAELLARVFPGAPRFGTKTLDLDSLDEALIEMLEKSPADRMAAYDVRRDRAEVMGFAAVVFSTLGRWLGVREFVSPGVGVREGIIARLVEDHFAGAQKIAPDMRAVASARRFATDLGADMRHAETVRMLAVEIFDGLKDVHRMDDSARTILEIGALLHDVGHVAGRFQHHRHGEYLVHSGVIPWIDDRVREIVACLVRFHGKTDPDNDHGIFERLPKNDKKIVKTLTGILRVADGLDAGRTAEVKSVKVTLRKNQAVFRLKGSDAMTLAAWGARRKAKLLEREIELTTVYDDGGGAT